MALVDFGELARMAREAGARLACVDVSDLAGLEAAVAGAEAAGSALVLRLSVADTPAFRALACAAESRGRESAGAVVVVGTGAMDARAATVAVNAGCNGLIADGAGLAACQEVAGACGVSVLDATDPVLGGADAGAAIAAADVRAWAPVDHVIVYNVDGTDDAGVAALMAEGKRALSAIAGVRWVETGTSVTDGSKFQHCWLVRFVHEDAIATYRDHPAHVAFADDWFRPVAGDRITIDFRAR